MCMWLFGPHSVYNGKQWDNGVTGFASQGHHKGANVYNYVAIIIVRYFLFVLLK